MVTVNAKKPFDSRTRADDVVEGLDLSGRTFVVTGANTGIGDPTARALSSAGARVIFACRNRAAGEAAVARTRAAHPGADAEFGELDLGSFASIRRFADTVQGGRIDALVCNAGLALMQYEETEDGFERTIGVCHVGHFLLARLLMPRLLASPSPRVVMVSSTSHRTPPQLDFDHLPLDRAHFKGMTAYGQAKLCNVLMAKALQQRYGARGLVACALHPGTLITTDIGRNSKFFGALIKLISAFTKNPNQGAATSVYATVHEPGSELAGHYLENCRVVACSDEANDLAVAQRLWTLSEQWLERAGPLPSWP